MSPAGAVVPRVKQKVSPQRLPECVKQSACSSWVSLTGCAFEPRFYQVSRLRFTNIPQARGRVGRYMVIYLEILVVRPFDKIVSRFHGM